MVLLRRVLGDALRQQRLGQRRTLREVSTEAKVSLGYLSEVERGQKEASSELLASICDALGVHLSDVLADVSGTLALAEQLPAFEGLQPNGDGASTAVPSGVRGGSDAPAMKGDGAVATKVRPSTAPAGSVTNSVTRTVPDADTALAQQKRDKTQRVETTLAGAQLADPSLADALEAETTIAEAALADSTLAGTVTDRPGDVRAGLRQVVAAA